MGEPCVSDEEQKPVAPKPAPAKPVAAKSAPQAGAEKPVKAAPPPDPRVEKAKEAAEMMKSIVVSVLGEDVIEATGAAHIRPMLLIRNEKWLDVINVLREHPDYLLDYVECMAGTDYPAYIEIVIYVQSTRKEHFVCLKTRTDREDAKVPSLVPAYPGVDWEEREIFDLLGVHFTNHPDLRRIMMPDDYVGHPLRKDFSPWD